MERSMMSDEQRRRLPLTERVELAGAEEEEQFGDPSGSSVPVEEGPRRDVGVEKFG